MKKVWFTFLSIVLASLSTLQAQGHAVDKQTFEEIQITEKLGEQIPIQDLHFKDEMGVERPLSDYFSDEKPVLVSLIYFGCPSLCGFLLNGMTEAMRRIDWSVGKEYRVLTFSVDPTEGPELASAKKQSYLDLYRRQGAETDWHFLTGTEDQLRALASSLGFGYKYMEETGEYAHSAGIFVLTPKGILSRTLYGIEFPEKDLKLALIEASDGKIGNVVDKFLMFCFRYDPSSKGYALHALRLVQATAGLFVLVFGAYLFIFWRNERKKRA